MFYIFKLIKKLSIDLESTIILDLFSAGDVKLKFKK